jgi:hypothetical protein
MTVVLSRVNFLSWYQKIVAQYKPQAYDCAAYHQAINPNEIATANRFSGRAVHKHRILSSLQYRNPEVPLKSTLSEENYVYPYSQMDD